MSHSIFVAWLTAKLGVDDERGANLVEYVLLVVLIAVICVVAITLIGTHIGQKYDSGTAALP
jgi:Flp pilus assembly pilin Flp